LTRRDTLSLIRADLHRYEGNSALRTFLRHIIINPGFRYTFWMRLCCYLGERAVWRWTLFWPVRLALHRCERRYGISISHRTDVGPGLHIGHFGGIVVSSRARIGRNCNLSHGVTIGLAVRGRHAGYPTIGDDVYIGPGAKIIGCVKVGNRVAIGANAVVTRDIPDDAVAVGVPAAVISDKGSAGYICHTDYEANEPALPCSCAEGDSE